MERPKVIYARVDDGADKLIVRYKAVEQAKNGSQHSISILRWAQLMAHEDVKYAQELALNLTGILKVRKIWDVCTIYFWRKSPFGCWNNGFKNSYLFLIMVSS
jgi:hypothetical protein